MYHSAKNFTMRGAMLSFICAGLLGFSQAAVSKAAETVSVASQPPLSSNVSFVKNEFPTLPVKKALKKKPTNAQVYQWDDKPLGDRSPFLFVHGLRGEYYPAFRWTKIIKKFTSNAEFDSKYKVYLLRHDSLATVKTIPDFQSAIASLYNASQKRPITVLALSIGGNLVYEGMHDKATDNAIRLAFTLGTPFRGSPIFCMDWLQYSVYKNLSFPWTRIDHSLAYKYYFRKNSGLVSDFGWDNADASIPNVGHFHSSLPLGPKGNLTVKGETNARLAELNSQPFDKKKLITYSGYLLNPFMMPDTKRKIDTTVMAPYTLLSVKIPSHFGREHPVLKWLNRDMGTMIPAKDVQNKTGTPFVYQLNDGITPVSSAVFLPQEACANAALVHESELPKLKASTDVHLARVFRNIDHLTFIDGYRPLNASSAIRDEMEPEAGTKQIFDWMLSDLLQFDQSTNKIAHE